MQIPKLTVLVEAGAVRTVEAIPDEGGWAVWITRAHHSGERREALERQRGGLEQGFAAGDFHQWQSERFGIRYSRFEIAA